MFTGRVVQPGEPQFLPEDTDGAVALAEEERDDCAKCGMPRAWCRDPRHQFAFEPVEDVCWPTWRLSQHQNGKAWEDKGEAGQAATVLSARFRPGVEPDIDAGLGLSVEQVPQADQRADDRQG